MQGGLKLKLEKMFAEPNKREEIISRGSSELQVG